MFNNNRVRNRRSRSRRNGRSNTQRLTRVERSLERVQQVVNVRLATLLTISSDNKSVIAGNIPADPSSSGLNITEFGQWATLFAQVRLLGMVTHWNCRTVLGSGGDTGVLCIASDMSSLVGTPTSQGVVLDNAGAFTWNYLRDNFSSRGKRIALQMSTQPTWADVTTPNPGNNVGCPGSIIYYGDDFPTAGSTTSTPFADVMVTVYLQFRSRQ